METSLSDTVKREELIFLCKEIFKLRGVSEKDSHVVSDVLVEANLRGHDSHGVIRVPKWIPGIEAGVINPMCKVKTIKETRAAVVLDGDCGLGPVVGITASNIAVYKAREVGVCSVSVRRASHIAMLAYYTEMMAKKGMIGVCMTNTEPGVAPFGGAQKILGTNPLSIAVPTRDHPLVLDMSTSVVARGKIVLALEKGEEIPFGWAVDSEGESTTDPKAALEGALLPVGGAKGSGLAIMVDILTGALAGAAVGKGVKGTFDMRREGTKGDFFLAIDPATFVDYDDFLDRVEELKNQIKQAKKAKGVDEIYLPGEMERLVREKRLKDGIPVRKDLIGKLKKLREERLALKQSVKRR